VVVVPENSAHPLLEARTKWTGDWGLGTGGSKTKSQNPKIRSLQPKTEDRRPRAEDRVPRLQLQLSPAPQSITVETAPRRDHFAPARYRDGGGWHEIVQAAGPDRVSGGQGDAQRTYAREYFRCVTNDGALVWLFRDAQEKSGGWYLHGWWD
ncbi:MAG TPA: hypothetical protein VN613_00220, partial [Gemmatimonadaceae bacterium]|nr:hypothetical protein [Gemmatimonadaceae bacterium]